MDEQRVGNLLCWSHFLGSLEVLSRSGLGAQSGREVEQGEINRFLRQICGKNKVFWGTIRPRGQPLGEQEAGTKRALPSQRWGGFGGTI